MKQMLLLCGLIVFGGITENAMALERDEGGFKISQTTADMMPLMDTLREINAPESDLPQPRSLSEQTLRELEHLRKTARTTPTDAPQRMAAAQSAWLLGLLYLHGAGVPLNSVKAKHWFALSVHYGEPIASAGMAWCAYEGCQSAPNWSQAQRWVQQLARLDPARAHYMQFLLDRQLRPLQPRVSEGLSSLTGSERSELEKAIAGGNVHAMLEMGLLSAQSQELDRALLLFEQAASVSEVARQNAEWLRQRMALERSRPAARPQGKSSTSQADVMFKAARQYHRGDGVAVNYVEAIRLYRQADAAGSPAARRMLSLIYSRTAPDGGLDPLWMRQLSEMDVASLVPKQDSALGISALRREPTPLIDLLPRKWQRLID